MGTSRKGYPKWIPRHYTSRDMTHPLPPPNRPVTIYLSIGNSDNNLTQGEWADYCRLIAVTVDRSSLQTHGEWYSLPNSPFQNACWCFETNEQWLPGLRAELRARAGQFRQESISLAIIVSQEFIEGVTL